MWRVPAEGGSAEPLARRQGTPGQWSSDGQELYFSGGGDSQRGLWAFSMEEGTEYPLTDLTGRPGQPGPALDADGEYLYFTWQEDLGDIWVMDVVGDRE